MMRCVHFFQWGIFFFFFFFIRVWVRGDVMDANCGLGGYDDDYGDGECG